MGYKMHSALLTRKLLFPQSMVLFWFFLVEKQTSQKAIPKPCVSNIHVSTQQSIRFLLRRLAGLPLSFTGNADHKKNIKKHGYPGEPDTSPCLPAAACPWLLPHVLTPSQEALNFAICLGNLQVLSPRWPLGVGFRRCSKMTAVLPIRFWERRLSQDYRSPTKNWPNLSTSCLQDIPGIS